ncbi:MAG: hypothetical protein KAW67_01445 [Candidatus Eisenbacteria sp.]|nr:hypothetical protein [Candidatus Eisenbacteria bacterium]
MVTELKELERRRYVGDSRTNLVHDRWHPDCEGCGLDEAVRSGRAVGFKPDTLDGALWAGYEYCEACHDKSEPPAPRWARVKTAGAEPGDEMRVSATRPRAPDLGYEGPHREMLASQQEREKAKITG